LHIHPALPISFIKNISDEDDIPVLKKTGLSENNGFPEDRSAYPDLMVAFRFRCGKLEDV